MHPGAAALSPSKKTHEAVAGFEFVELTSDKAGWIREFGYPAYVVPVVNSVWRGDPRQPETKLAPYTSCCIKNRCQPMLEYLAATRRAWKQRSSRAIASMPASSYSPCTPASSRRRWSSANA